MTQADLFATYPDAPGHTGPDTSRAGADFAAGYSATLQGYVLAALKRRPQTSADLSRTLREPYESIQPRTAELRKKGLIEDSGARGPSRNPNRQAIVWRVT